MKKIILIPWIFIIVLTNIPQPIQSNSSYIRYTNKRYKFSISIPKGWTRQKIDLGYKHLYILSKNRYTEIKITAAVPDLKDIEKWDRWQDWYTDGIGGKIRKITESKDVVMEENIIGKMLLFDYTENRKRILQRVLIAKFDSSLIVIECKAPVSSFHRYGNTFNQVMGSLQRAD